MHSLITVPDRLNLLSWVSLAQVKHMGVFIETSSGFKRMGLERSLPNS